MHSLPKKAYYSISEVAKATGLEQHVIRYWESEFPKLSPRKNRAGNRQFREKDITIIKYIKHLLHNEMYTIQGARKKLADAGYKELEGQLDLLNLLPPVAPPAPPLAQPLIPSDGLAITQVKSTSANPELLQTMLQELKSIKALLKA